ncbi:DUF4153 domain-containing protein [Tsuneonella sp. HG222]
MDGDAERPEWPLRPWFLAAGMGAAGFLVWAFGEGGDTSGWRMAATAFFFFGSIAAAFTIERDRWKQPLAFALVAGLVMAGLAWRAVLAGERYADPQYGFAAGVIATALALPLFQAGFLRDRFRTPYERVHRHVWNDAIGAGGSLAFVGASWLVLIVLGALFNLLKMRFLYELMEQGWFGWTWSATAFGAALGMIREQERILASLRGLVTTILSVLAVPLALGLAVFLGAMVVSGPDMLWQATRNATPILLACAAGSWVLANAILRDSDHEMTGNRVLRWAACALVLAILPLTVFAAVSLGTRVAQHGLSPERLWGLIAIAVACAYGLAWLVALVRGWKGGAWRERLRRANLHLAAAICVVAFVLALPIFDFGAISARNQVARLQSGSVSAEDFDYAALRWDFGDAGRRALARLERSGNAKVAELAALARKQTARQYGYQGERTFRTESEIDVRVQPDEPALRKLVIDHLRGNSYLCDEFCIALDLGPGKDAGQREVAFVQNGRYQRVSLPSGVLEPRTEVAPAASATFGRDSTVEVRTLPRRYIVVDGRPVGETLDGPEAIDAVGAETDR